MEEKNSPLTNNQIQEIIVILNEIKEEQGDLSEQVQKRFKGIFEKLMKIEEYNKISDMTNQVFEMRLSNIEDFLFSLEQYIRNNKINT